MKNLFKLGLVALMSVCALGFSRAEEAGDSETFTVTPAGKSTVGNDSVLFDSIATFTMKVEGKTTADTNYQIVVKYFASESDTVGIESDYVVADTIVELVAVYDGDYKVTFELQRRNEGAKAEWRTVGTKTFYIRVTNYPAPAPLDINFDVKAAGNTMQGEKVVFADGNVAFDIFVTGADVDTNYRVAVSIWNKAEIDAFEGPQPTLVKITEDSIRYIDGIFYNDEYEATFELRVYDSRRNEYIAVDNKEAITIPFLVTEREAPAPDPSIKVEPVGATNVGDTNYVFAPGKVAFDVLLQNMEELDTNYYFAMAVCTKAQFEDTNYTVDWKIEKIAQKVQYSTELKDNGEYVALFELRAPADTIGRDGEAEYKVVSGDFIFFTVGTVANENVELAGVNVYPNPNAGTFNVAVPERARIDIFGLNGAKVMSREVNAGVEAFSINHSGIYFVRVMAGNKTAVKRVVVR